MQLFASSSAASQGVPAVFDLDEPGTHRRRARKALLLAFDRSAAARCALDYAIAHARAEGLLVHLVNVQPMPRDEPVFHGPVHENGERILDIARVQLEDEGIRHSSEIRFGHVATEIVDAAGRAGCSLIVIGARSRGAFSRLFSASVSSEVSRFSPVPVAVVKHAVTSFVHAPWTFFRRRNAA